MLSYITPALVSAICVSLYWLIVIIKIVLITPRIGKMPNVIPKEWSGMLSRVIMFPFIVSWNYYAWYAFYALPAQPINGLAWVGALCAFVAVMLSCYCWYYMGCAWRIGIDPNEKNRLITDGPFKYIRHPIYSLSMLLMLGCFLATQSIAMFSLLCLHWLLFTAEALREEKYLRNVHGAQYDEYVKNSSLFFPHIKIFS